MMSANGIPYLTTIITLFCAILGLRKIKCQKHISPLQLYKRAWSDRGRLRQEPSSAGEAVLAQGGPETHRGGVLTHTGLQTGQKDQDG